MWQVIAIVCETEGFAGVVASGFASQEKALAWVEREKRDYWLSGLTLRVQVM